MKNIKQINIENRLYYFFDEMISITNFDPILLDIDKFSLSNDIIIYKIRYITMRSIDNGNLHLNFNNLGEYLNKIMEINTWFLLLQTRTKKYKKYTELWHIVKNQIEIINGGKLIKHKKDFMENMFESDAGLPLGKILCNPIMIIVARSAFQKDIKCYLKVYLQECRYEL